MNFKKLTIVFVLLSLIFWLLIPSRATSIAEADNERKKVQEELATTVRDLNFSDSAAVSISTVPPAKPTQVSEMVSQEAIRQGVSVELALYIASNESHFVPSSVGDMDITCPQGVNKGKPVRARGVWQITQCWYPKISDEQAFDPYWSTVWTISQLKKGKEHCISQWSTCRKYYSDM